MKKSWNLLLVVGLLFTVTIYGCKKDNNTAVCETNSETNESDLFHPNGIKKLSATPIEVIQSTYTLGTDPEQVVNSMDIDEIDDANFVVLSSEGELYVSAGEDFEEFGEIVILAVDESNIYQGENFDVVDNDSHLVLTGQVTNADNVTSDLTITMQQSQFGAGSTSYTVDNDEVLLNGTLGTHAYNQIIEINSDYPAVRTIVLMEIPGSLNDEINVETGRLIREAGYTTDLRSTSEIYSGGVDLFCSGLNRTAETGATIGVHSWCCYDGVTADQLPMDSPGHDSQLSYFSEMLGDDIGPDFYFFTLQAAPFDGIHEMTDEEIEQYQLITD